MAGVLIIFAHPAFQKSRVNRQLLASLAGLEQVTVHDLYELYPDFHIRVRQEQALLREHAAIIFQHPFYWYNVPALFKEWMDLVLAHGFAYGTGGQQLKAKRLLSVITAGGSPETYRTSGENEVTREKLLLPFAKLATLCGMNYLDPLLVLGTHTLTDEALSAQALLYRRRVEELIHAT